MFRAIISPIFRSTRLCVTAYGIMHPRCCRPVSWKRRKSASRIPATATSWVHYTTSCNTQSSAPEDGRDHRPKHVEMIGIINKPLLLHLVGVYIMHRYMFLVSDMRCQVEVSASGWSLVQRSPTECGVSECVREALLLRKPWPNGGCYAMKELSHSGTIILIYF